MQLNRRNSVLNRRFCVQKWYKMYECKKSYDSDCVLEALLKFDGTVILFGVIVFLNKYWLISLFCLLYTFPQMHSSFFCPKHDENKLVLLIVKIFWWSQMISLFATLEMVVIPWTVSSVSVYVSIKLNQTYVSIKTTMSQCIPNYLCLHFFLWCSI